MVSCENCGDDVPHRFEHRVRAEVMTHRQVRLVCADCHPNLAADLKYESPAGAGMRSDQTAD
ncbi:hypothetical protein [Natranaeroarchaeum sulfidigenes]|uniref:Uncharacterized protein n=1 Tax=Natranaeroarchaeum sulfidigenes TaxID=2784880 RepID=A0A897ML10_9EURY|nr:hypothetical protein [Natranaeroarchaeum sulfidigenes]QSG01247.1 Uncharacterized protein AArcS_0004 [Natranaeroarchaeum sulfidigenes]